MRPTRYDPRRTILTFGVIPLLGYAPGTFVSARRVSPTWRTVAGTNGEMRRMRRSGTAGVIEATFRQTSEANRILGILHKIDETTAAIIAPLAITDTLNGALQFTVDAYIESYAPITYGTTEPNIVWTFRCDELEMNYPGLSFEVAASTF